MTNKNIKEFLRINKNPQLEYKTIHILGTNGKGSTAYFLSQLIEKKCKVGLYISPFKSNRFDNIYVQGKNIEEVNGYYKLYKSQFQKFGLSEFEEDTALASIIFKLMDVKYAIFEVGIETSNDATNVILPDYTLITSTSLDHEDILGTNFKDIALNLSELFKEKSKIFVSRKIKKSIKNIYIKQAKKINSKIIFDKKIKNIKKYPYYQERNIELALKVFKEIFNEENVSLDDLKMLPFRFEKIKNNIILDGAHNVEGVKLLVKTLIKLKISPVVIFSSLDTKNFKKMTQVLIPSSKKIYVTTFDIKNSINIKQAKAIKGTEYLPKNKILDKLNESNRDIILVTGSLYFLREVRGMINEK